MSRPISRLSKSVLCFSVLAAIPVARGQDAPAPAATPTAASDTPPAPPKAPGFERSFPSDTMWFFGIDDVDELFQQWNASAWGRMVADKRADGVRSAFHSLLDALGQSSKDEVGLDVIELARGVAGRIGLALGNTDPTHGSFATNRLATLLAADVGEQAAAFNEQIVTVLEKQAAERGAVMKRESGACEFVTVTPKGDDVAMSSFAQTGPTLVFGADLPSLEGLSPFPKLLDSLVNGAKESVGELPDFRASLAALPGGVKLFAQTGSMIRAAIVAGEEDPETAQMFAIQRVLGLDHFGALSGRFDLNGAEMRIETVQAWGEGWLPKLVDAFFADADTTLMKLVPVDAIGAGTLHLDLATGIDEFTKASAELGIPSPFDAPPPADPTAEGAAPAAAAAPIDPRKDVIDHLDGRLALFGAPVDESEQLPMVASREPMNLVLVAGVKNADALRATLDRFLRSQGLHAARKKREFEGFELYSLQIGPQAVHYAIVDDFLAVSLSPTLLEDVLRRKSHPELANLAAEPAFKAQFEALHHSDSLVVWTKADGNTLGSLSNQATQMEERYAEIEGSDPALDPSAKDPVQARAMEFGNALSALDPQLLRDYLPRGAVLGLGADPSGVWIEGVSR